jgi:hypothetical protein
MGVAIGLGLNLFSILAVAAWQPGWTLAAAMGLLLLPGVWLVLQSVPPREGQLFWDGADWHLDGPQTMQGRLTLVLDLQQVLLLRWTSPISEAPHATRWLWLEKSGDPVIWMDVRRAVYWNAR